MFDEVIGALGFSTKFEGEEVDLGGLRYKPVPFSHAFFKKIETTKGKSLAFVDGGNAEILKAPNFSLQLCRVAYCIFEQGKRAKQERKDFFVLVNVVNGKFVVKTFGEQIDVSFDLDDEHFKTGKNRGSASSVVAAVRRFAELKLASSLSADVVVLDGSLQQTYSFEDKFLRLLQNKTVIGFNKTSSWLTKSGNSVNALLNLHKGAFLYHPLVALHDETYAADVCFARLHERSNYVFKLDCNKEANADVVAALAANATDPVFLGYPYGLVLADKLARVTNNEAEYLKTKVLSKIKNEDLLRYLNALNAHDVLDKI
jgi:hypothetical protein